MSLLNIAAGVILILLGMRHLRKGLDRLFGNRLIDWLQESTANRGKSFLAGVVAGTIAPSSTSIALMSVQMLNRAALPASRMLAVVLGANVGITVTVQLLSFHLEDSAAALLIAGGVTFLYLKRPVFRGAGQVALAFGLIFLAMQMVGAAARTIASSGDLAVIFQIVEHHPLALLVVTAILTLFMQSSTASIALGLGLAQGGLLGPAVAVPWVIGTNLGIAATSLIAGWPTLEGRRLGVGNLIVKAAGAVVILILLPGVAPWLWARFPLPVNREWADFHTGFNLILGLAALPLVGSLSKLVSFIVETPPEGSEETESFLDPLLLQSPSLALNQSVREEFRMMDQLKTMLRTVQALAEKKDPVKLELMDQHRKRLDSIGERLNSYLGQIGDDSLSAADIRRKFILLNYIQELVAVGILIYRDLADSAIHQAKSGTPMPPEEKADIATLFKRTLERMEKATSILMSEDTEQAEAFILEKEQISHMCRHAQRLHHERSAANTAPTQAVSDYIDQLNCLRRINSHLTSAAYALARPHSSALEENFPSSGLGER
ncbi:MAG: Na/Pi symporter [Opitutaceae bacterium]|jgi:phosphate:Na+ symporter